MPRTGLPEVLLLAGKTGRDLLCVRYVVRQKKIYVKLFEGILTFYILSTIAFPNSEHFSSVAPSICRSRS
mgnify:CR=1 FL=1